jgi:hypothetical protein
MSAFGIPLLPLVGLFVLAAGVTALLNAADANGSVAAIAVIALGVLGGLLAAREPVANDRHHKTR